ncbi:hypothetical protein LSAT2_025216 [Lamellibrachia satsuma]|nr:hypothetical protein LSAT2_025216 [Lamellibrachia satsuma]
MTPTTEEHDSDSEDCVSDEEQSLDLDDIVASSELGTVVKSLSVKFKIMLFHLYDSGEMIRVRGHFIVSDPWWAARMTVTKHSDFWELCGSAAYYLRQDERVVNDKVVPLFLTSCKVESEHLQMFIDSLRSIGKANQLTFKTLPTLLGEFAAMSEDNKAVAGILHHLMTAPVSVDFFENITTSASTTPKGLRTLKQVQPGNIGAGMLDSLPTSQKLHSISALTNAA